MTILNSQYWNNRYLTDDFRWDIGYVSTPIKEYIDQLKNKQVRILVPGAGNAWEVEYLHRNGFANVHLLDYSSEALVNFQNRVRDFPSAHLHEENFFDHKGQYDLILEQTFFCAIDPSLRKNYAVHMHQLLKPGGKLVGLLFDDMLNSDKPPYGGTKEEYISYFNPYFELKNFEAAYNSIAPRKERELFIRLKKKDVISDK